MSEDEQVKKAMDTLHGFVLDLGGSEDLWDKILVCPGVLKELAYFHDTGDLWGGFTPEGITIFDAVAWQVDHFKAYMDREENNRWHRERLFLESLETLADISRGDRTVLAKIKGEGGESGTDRENP